MDKILMQVETQEEELPVVPVAPTEEEDLDDLEDEEEEEGGGEAEEPGELEKTE